MEKIVEDRKLEEEEKIKEEILTADIQNEILLPNKQTELRGEQKQKQWARCVEGLARHRALKKKQTEEEKMKREQEKLAMKQKIREELIREKLKAEVEKELTDNPQTVKLLEEVKAPEVKVDVKQPQNVQLNLQDLEEYIQWKKQKKRKTVDTPKKEEIEDQSEQDDYIPEDEEDVQSEEDEEIVARERYKRSRLLPPKANLVRTVSHGPLKSRPTQPPRSTLYNSAPPGRFFYI